MGVNTGVTGSMKVINRRIACAAVLLPIVCPWVAAADFEGGVTAGVSRSDNVFLAGSGNEVDDLVYQVTPFVNYSYDSQHLDVLLDYAFDWYRYDDLGTSSRFHRGQAQFIASALQDDLALEFGASRVQALSDPDQAIPTGNLPISGNIVDQDEIWINPRVSRDLGRTVSLNIDYRLSELRFNDNGPQLSNALREDSTNHDGRFSLDNLASSSGFTWALRYDYQETDYDEAVSFEFQRASAELGYRIGEGLRVFGSGGQESAFDNPIDASLEDTFWEGGFSISRNDTFTLELAAGERTFGSSWRGSLDWQFLRGSTSLSYSETPTTTGQNRGRNAIGILDNTDLDELLDRIGSPERFISERLEWRVDLNWRRTGLSLSLFDEDRTGRVGENSISLPDESQSGIAADFNWQAGARTSFILGASMARRESAPGSESDILNASVGVDYRLGSRTSVALTFQHVDQDPRGVPAVGPDYVANLVSLLFTFTL